MKRFIDIIVDQLNGTTDPFESLSEGDEFGAGTEEALPNTTALEVPATKEVEVKGDPGKEFDLFTAEKQLEDITRQIQAHHQDGINHWTNENHEVCMEIAKAIGSLKQQAIKLAREIHEMKNTPEEEKKQ